jgi:cytochrome b involved in lipid metabolism
VILDDLVIDVKDFQFQHPGGKFVIQQNIGRDISKFFYGGYSMEDNLGPKPG